MSAPNEPLLPATIEVDLDEFSVQGDNSFRIWVRLESDTYLALDFAPESDGHREIVEALSDAVGIRLSRLSAHGVVITGLTAPEGDAGEGSDGS